MQLRELKQGKRFEFVDKVSGFLLHTGEKHTAMGVFKFVGYANYGCPILYNEALCADVVADLNTARRDVLIIL